jgi:hypothetical protein
VLTTMLITVMNPMSSCASRKTTGLQLYMDLRCVSQCLLPPSPADSSKPWYRISGTRDNLSNQGHELPAILAMCCCHSSCHQLQPAGRIPYRADPPPTFIDQGHSKACCACWIHRVVHVSTQR